MNIVIIADVGDPTGYHAGDEAMLDAAIGHLRRRGVHEITVISADPTATTERHGVSAIEPLGFLPGTGGVAREAREALLAATLGLTDGAGPDDDRGGKAVSILRAAVSSADGVVVAGGGNLSSSWPHHLYERVALLGMADQLGVPSVVTGQTIGPNLTHHEQHLLHHAMAPCRLVGLRETDSLRLATSLLGLAGRAYLHLDDAIDLPGEPVPAFPGSDRLASGFVALTVDLAWSNEPASLDGLVRLVETILDRTGLPVAFVPHVGSAGDAPTGDLQVGGALSARLGPEDGLVLCPMLPARQVAGLTRRASAVVSSRYHPLVFGLSAALPGLGLYQDAYTETKLRGALAHAGLGGWCLPAASVVTDLPGRLFDELWLRRSELQDHLQAVTADWGARQEEHWDLVSRALHCTQSDPSGEPPRSAGKPTNLPPMEPTVAAINEIALEQLRRHRSVVATAEERFAEAEHYALDLRARLTAKDADINRMMSHVNDLANALDAATARVADLELGLDSAEAGRAAAQADNIILVEETVLAEEAAEAARMLVIQLRRELDVLSGELASALEAKTEVSRLRDELAAIHAIKTMRWTHRPRAVYGRIRQMRRSTGHLPDGTDSSGD